MRINHNIAALGAYRYLSGANKSLASSLEKLSSGLRINRASDDAAGMAISEKMKAQIRGLSQASRNSLDAVSLIQTAEGALNEVHSMLQRMRELAVQSANGTLTIEDREKNQSEIDQLTQAIDIVSRDTEFNTKKLLRGSDMQVGNTFVFGVDRSISRSAMVGSVTYTGAGAAQIDLSGTITAGNVVEVGDRVYEFVDGNPAQEGNLAVELNPPATTLDRLYTVMQENMPTGVNVIGRVGSTFNVSGDNNYYVMTNVSKSITLSFVGVPSAGDTLTLGSKKFVFANSADVVAAPGIKVDLGGVQNIEDVMDKLAAAASVPANLPGGATFTDMVGGGIKDGRYEFKLLLDNVVSEADMEAFNINAASTDMFVSVQIGANSAQNLILQVNNMSASKLGISFTATGTPVTDFYQAATNGVPIITPDDAEDAIDIIENAIDMVSQERAKLGSYQNRLEHTIKNLAVSEENLTASLSRIEDADMALEMSNYTKFNILVQSGTAMLAQANQIPQSVLQLLK